MARKITVIGAGNVGASLAVRIFEKGYADVVMLDVAEGLAKGKALDISQTAQFFPSSKSIKGTADYADTAGSDIVIVTAGAARKPGMSRTDLLKINQKIITDIVTNIAKHSPDCVLIMVTNPVDVMTYLAIKISGFPKNRVFGLSGVLDGARFTSFIAEELGVPAASIIPCVLGEHGQNMVIIPRLTMAGGKPLTDLVSEEKALALVNRAVNGGAEIVAHLKTGSAYYAPSASAAKMADAVFSDTKEVLNCVALLEGEYGLEGVTTGVPVKLGKNGVEKIIELNLTQAEKEAFGSSAEAVKTSIKSLGI